MLTTIFAKHLFDGTGAEPLHDAFVQIEGDRITRVGTRNELGSSVVGQQLDLGDATLLPGLINMHTHLTCSAGWEVLKDALEDSYDTKLMRAVENARKTVRSGVTTVRDCGTLNSIIFSLRDASAEGLIEAPHIWASGEVLTSTGGHCYFFGVECDSVEDIKKAVRDQVKAGADYIKVMSSGGGLTPNTSPEWAQFNREEMIALVQDSNRIGKRVASHCHGTPSIVNSVAAKVTTIEHCSFRVPGGLKYEQPVADSVAEAGIYVVPTLSNGWRRMQRAQQEGREMPPNAAERDQRAFNLRRLIESGVKIVSGSDAGMSFTEFDDFQLDLEHLVEFIGFSPADAIVTATGRAAEAIGSDNFGVLTEGKRADILGVHGNAVEQIEQLRDIALVLKSGKPVVGDLPTVA